MQENHIDRIFDNTYVVRNFMTVFTPDNRKPNVLLLLGIIFIALTWLTLALNSTLASLIWTAFVLVVGIMFLSIGLFYRYKVKIDNKFLVLSNRIGLFVKVIHLDDIGNVKVIDREYPVTLYRNTLIHLLLWDKKFSRSKQIELFDTTGRKLFTIDGQTIDNKDFGRLVRALK